MPTQREAVWAFAVYTFLALDLWTYKSEHALGQVIFAIMADNMKIFKQYQDNPSFKKGLSDWVFQLTYNKGGKPYQIPTAKTHNAFQYEIPKPDVTMVAEPEDKIQR